jgi:peptidyl-dipeptidase Dcp
MSSVTNVTSPSTKSNPLLEDWSLEPFGLPPFSRYAHIILLPLFLLMQLNSIAMCLISVNVEHFKPAFDVAIAAHISELEAIAAVPDEKVSFETICVAFDRAGEQMSRISKLFSNLCSSNAPPALQAVELQMAGPLAAHENRIYTLPNLFSRIDSLYSKRAELNLQPEALRLVERLHLDFVRAGARFSPADQKQYGEITEKLAALTTQFTQNVLADEEEFVITLKLEDLSGCPPGTAV